MEYNTPKMLLDAINTAQLENISLEEVQKFIEVSWSRVEEYRLKMTKIAMNMTFGKGGAKKWTMHTWQFKKPKKKESKN